MLLRTYTDGINCTDFGQSYVASIGYSDAGNPVLLNGAGSLEVVDSSFDVGCSKCARLISKDTGEAVREFTTPSWDLTLVGLTARMEKHFFFDDEARVFLRNDSGGNTSHCLEINNDQPFRIADAAHCLTATRIIGRSGLLAEGIIDIELDGGERLLENSNSSSYYMQIYAGACT